MLKITRSHRSNKGFSLPWRISWTRCVPKWRDKPCPETGWQLGTSGSIICEPVELTVIDNVDAKHLPSKMWRMRSVVFTASIHVGHEPPTTCCAHFVVHAGTTDWPPLASAECIDEMVCGDGEGRASLRPACPCATSTCTTSASNVVCNIGRYVALSIPPHLAPRTKLPSWFVLTQYRAIMCCKACSASLASPDTWAAPPARGVQTAACFL
jgi:hypothetical protein